MFSAEPIEFCHGNENCVRLYIYVRWYCVLEINTSTPESNQHYVPAMHRSRKNWCGDKMGNKVISQLQHTNSEYSNKEMLLSDNMKCC